MMHLRVSAVAGPSDGDRYSTVSRCSEGTAWAQLIALLARTSYPVHISIARRA
jgi:hypothetical protein